MSHEAMHHDGKKPAGYIRLLISLLASVAVMFPLTMVFVAQWSDFHLNLSNFYMALAMVAPMGLIMLATMPNMFPNTRLNAGLVAGLIALFAIALWLGRAQAFVGDEQFLRAMIPHHSRAILVCENASISDQEIKALCDQIISSQQEEIDIMERMLGER